MLQRLNQCATPLVIAGKLHQCLLYLLVQVFALESGPFLEGRTVTGNKLVEETAPIKRSGLLEACVTGGTARGVAMGMRLTRGEQGGEVCHIEGEIGVRVELDRLARD